ncbi:MAG: hypothetical protein Q8936_19485 [Bacillota bacterium]|nr:hypothetical protein [Bacillota bacterium]
MARPRKIKEENIENVIEEKQETNVSVNNSNDLFTPENMAKMFAMFEQFSEMKKQKDNNEQIKQDKITKEEKKETKKYERFSKSMLMQIRDEMVTVRSVVNNVNFSSPISKITYRWKEKGAVQILPISEILAMDNHSSRFLFTPWLIVEDDRVIDALGLARTYELVSKVEDISQLIKLSEREIEDIFNELPKNYQNNFKNEIFRKVRIRELNDLKTIDILSKVLHMDLKDIETEEEMNKRK